MPRMPTEDDLSSPQIRSPAVASRRQDFIGPALARAGQVISANAEADTNQELKIKRQEKGENDAMDLARARADWNTRRLTADENYQLEKNPEYNSWEKGYSGEITKHRDAAASKIRDPKLRERFMLDTEDDITRGTFGVRDRAKGYDRGKRRAEALASIDQNMNLAASPGIDPKESAAITAKTRADIDNLFASGLLTPEQTVELRQKYFKGFQETKVKQDIQNDPEQAYQYLKGDPGEIYFKKLAMQESGGRDNAKAGTSSATGRYQFIDSTWAAVRKAHPELNLTADGRTNRDQSERAIRAFTADNAQALRAAGLPVSEASLYMAHFMGTGGAIRMLKADPNGNAAALFPESARANSTIFFTKDGKARSVGEVIAIQTKRFRGGNSGPAPDYYSNMSPEDRDRYASAAEGEYSARVKQQQEVSALDRYEVKNTIEDDIAQITETGKGTDIEPQRVVDTLGEAEAAKWLENRDVAVKTYEAVSGMDNMTEEQISQHLDGLEPSAGDDNFANSQKIYDKAEKKAAEITRLRTSDPALSVESSSILQSVKAQIKPDDPMADQHLIRARLAAQAAVGIPAGLREPITVKEARMLALPMQGIIDQMDMAISEARLKPGQGATGRKMARMQAEAELLNVYEMAKEKYGPYANQAIMFSITQTVRDKDVAGQLTAMIAKSSKGVRPTQTDNRALEDMTDASIAEKAVTGQLPKPAKPEPMAAPTRTPQPTNRRGSEGATPKQPEKQGVYAKPDRTAIDKLIANPQDAEVFDNLFGPGASAQWLKKE